METTNKLEDLVEKNLNDVVIDNTPVILEGQEGRDYVTSDEVYANLMPSYEGGNFGKCVWGQCDYARN